MGDHLHNEAAETARNQVNDRRWLDGLPDFIRRSLPHVQTVTDPIAVYAMYDDGPDQRATLRYGTDNPEHPEVVVKVNRYSFLSGSPAAHRLVSRCSPAYVPWVIAAEVSPSGSLILLAIFEGRPLNGVAGMEPLLKMAKTLAKIQLDCAEAAAVATGLETVRTADLPRLFDECLANIEAHFAAWQGDDGKIEKAMGFPGCEVLNRLRPLRPKVDEWVTAVEAAAIPLSIDHGDCHSGNAALTADGSVLLFDWENACRSHPFFSMEKVLTAGWGLDTGNTGGPWGYVRNTPTQDVLKRAYLGEFGRVTPVLDRAFDAAMCLAVIKEMLHEMEWARRCGWQDLNPEWTAQLIKRLFEHHEHMTDSG